MIRNSGSSIRDKKQRRVSTSVPWHNWTWLSTSDLNRTTFLCWSIYKLMTRGCSSSCVTHWISLPSMWTCQVRICVDMPSIETRALKMRVYLFPPCKTPSTQSTRSMTSKFSLQTTVQGIRPSSEKSFSMRLKLCFTVTLSNLKRFLWSRTLWCLLLSCPNRGRHRVKLVKTVSRKHLSQLGVGHLESKTSLKRPKEWDKRLRMNSWANVSLWETSCTCFWEAHSR